MVTRQLAVLIVLLMPASALADKHNLECAVGLSREWESSAQASYAAKRLACGRQVYRASASPVSPDPAPAVVNPSDQSRVWKNALFVFAEVAEYDGGRDTGRTLDGFALGARYYWRGPKRVEPFVHGVFGLRRPSFPDPSAGDGDDGTLLGTAAFGGGADIELDIKRLGVVPALRVQLEVAGSHPGFALHLRPTVGLSFRLEH